MTIKYVTPRSGILKKVLTNWFEVTTDYASEWSWKDVHWWYGERTAIGFLAAAVWKSGGVALEEYRTKKKSKTTPGRCDLHFRLARNASYIVEAKKLTVWITDKSEKSMNKIREALDLAHKDATRLTEPEKKLGIAFVSFRVRKKYRDCTPLIKKWDEVARNQHFFDHAAWIFPGEARAISRWACKPGTAIFIREA